MSSQYSGCAEVLVLPFAALARRLAPEVDESLARLRATVGDRGCFLLLVSVALMAVVLPVLLFDLGWEWLVLLGGFLTLIVIGVGSSYRLGSGQVATGIGEAHSAGGRATSGPELIARYQAGERDFREASLRSAMLLHLDLSGVDLSGANLRDAQLDRTELRGAILFDADLRGADLQSADLTGANLPGANLEGARLNNANLRGANLVGANLEHAKLVGADLVDADLSGADLSRTNLQRAQLAMADLTGTNLERAALDEAGFSGADLTGSSVRQEQLSVTSSLEGATLPDGTEHDLSFASGQRHPAVASERAPTGLPSGGTDGEPVTRDRSKRSRWPLPLAGCAGAATAILPGLALLVAVALIVRADPYGPAVGLALGAVAGIVLVAVGGGAGALLGLLLGAIGRAVGREMKGDQGEAIGGVIGGILGGVVFLVAVLIFYLTEVAS